MCKFVSFFQTTLIFFKSQYYILRFIRNFYFYNCVRSHFLNASSINLSLELKTWNSKLTGQISLITFKWLDSNQFHLIPNMYISNILNFKWFVANITHGFFDYHYSLLGNDKMLNDEIFQFWFFYCRVFLKMYLHCSEEDLASTFRIYA